jgi:hypothetical protein
MELDKQQIKAKAKVEFTRMVLLTIYLATLFGAVTTYKRLILAEHGIPFAEYGYSVINALVLAKVILIAGHFRIGSRFNERRLVIPALFKTLCFSSLVLALAVAERLIKGWWAGASTSAMFQVIVGPEKWAILSRVMMLFFALIPFFAFWETNRVLGGGILYRLFFTSTRRDLLIPARISDERAQR